MGTSRRVQEPPNGGIGWYVTTGALICMYVCFGIPRTMGVFVTILVAEFKCSSTEIGWIVTTPLMILQIASPVAGVLVQKYGCRSVGLTGGMLLCTGFFLAYFTETVLQLFITVGLLPGLGMSCLYVSSVVSVSQYFTSLYIIANGIMFFGGPLAFITMPIITENLLYEYSWRGAFLVLSGVAAQSLVGSMMMRPIYLRHNVMSGNDELEDNNESICKHGRRFDGLRYMVESTGVHLLFRNPTLITMIPSVVMLDFCYEAWLIFVIPQAEELNISPELSAFIICCTGVGSIVGRLIQIVILHYEWIKSFSLFFWACLFAFVSIAMDPIFHNFNGLLIISFVYGIFTGIIMPLVPIIIKETVQSYEFPIVLGWINMIRGIGTLLGGLCTGALRDIYGNYFMSFVCVSAVQLAAFLSLLLLPFLRKCMKTR